MELSANLFWLYRHLPPSGDIEAAAEDGFRAVEIALPYDQPPAHYASRLRGAGTELVLINTPLGGGAGRVGWAAVPGGEAAFRAGFDRARAVAAATGCRRIHVMAGQVEGCAREACEATLRRNLAQALGLAAADGLMLTLEPLNRVDAPGYFYHRPEQAVAVLREFDSPLLRLQFDFYHCLMEGLDPGATLAACAPWIGHVQIGGAEGRYEPDLGRDHLLAAVAALPGLGYDSWLGCEYRPRSTPREGLVWCAPLRARGLLP